MTSWCFGSLSLPVEVHAPFFSHHLERLLSSIALQSSVQDSSLLRGGCSFRCLLWQHENKMCSQLGLGSTPEKNENGKLQERPFHHWSNGKVFGSGNCPAHSRTFNGILVIKEQISRHNCFISGQNYPLHKFGTQVLLNPAVLSGEERSVSEEF